MLVVFVLLYVAVSVGSAQEPAAERPKFEDYPVAEAFEGAPAPVILDTTAKRWYKTRLTVGSKQWPNFAGHYSFVGWGCGSNCWAGAVVDLKTGTVIDPPYFYSGDEKWVICGRADGNGPEPHFRLDSRLVRVECGYGKPDEAYFILESGKFREIAHFDGKPPYRKMMQRGREILRRRP